ncbi:hypothetical protein ACFQ9X_49745 [Catenulispora yoronensis]
MQTRRSAILAWLTGRTNPRRAPAAAPARGLDPAVQARATETVLNDIWRERQAQLDKWGFSTACPAPAPTTRDTTRT